MSMQPLVFWHLISLCSPALLAGRLPVSRSKPVCDQGLQADAAFLPIERRTDIADIWLPDFRG